jgi:hypothetical protein
MSPLDFEGGRVFKAEKSFSGIKFSDFSGPRVVYKSA